MSVIDLKPEFIIMGCGGSSGPEEQIFRTPPPPAVDLSGHGLPSALPPAPSSGPPLPLQVRLHNGDELAVEARPQWTAGHLKAHLFDRQPEELPPPSVATLEFSGTVLDDSNTLEQYGVCPEAVVELSWPQSSIHVEFYGVSGFRMVGSGPDKVRVWAGEPVHAMLARGVRKVSRETDRGRLANMVGQSWYAHTDTGGYSRPVRVSMEGTVEQAGITDGVTLVPGKQVEYFQNEQKERFIKVGSQVLYYGDMVELVDIDRTAGRAYFVIRHDGQEKRTIIEKLELA